MDAKTVTSLLIETPDNISTDNEERATLTDGSLDRIGTEDKTLASNREKPTTSTIDEVKQIKHSRYWSSWEEITLVELWYKYKNEIGESKKACPIFQTIGNRMRAKGFDLTAQECQRKIRSYFAKYFEVREHSSKSPSKWRLYSAVEYIISKTDGAPPEDQADTAIRRRLLKAGSSTAGGKEIKSEYKNESSPRIDPNHCSQRLTMGKTCHNKRSTFLKRRCTKANLQLLHEDNRRLASRREMDLQRLKFEEQQLLLMEMLLPKILANNEQFLCYMGNLKEKMNNKTGQTIASNS